MARRLPPPLRSTREAASLGCESSNPPTPASRPVRSLRRISGLFESARDCRKINASRTGFRLCENCRHSRGRLTGFWRDTSSTVDVSPGRDIYLRGDGTGSAAAYFSLEPISKYRLLSIRYKCGVIRLTNEQWERIRKHFPEEHIPDGRPGRKPIPTRHVLEAVL